MGKERSFNFTAADLIPEHWDLTAGTVEDIVFFGKVTIRQMVRSWRYDAKSLSQQIKSVDEKLKFLQGKNAAVIRELAKAYERPQFTPDQIGLREDSWGDPEPLDEASKERKAGATTFNVCGWCEYASGGTCRYYYHITTYCGFITDAGRRGVRRRFYSTCFLTRVSAEVFGVLHRRLGENLERLCQEKREVDAKIKLLLKLERRAEPKPALPDHRPHDWFNVDDPVVCFVGDWEEAKRITSKQWVTAKVILGYRHHDGCVSVRYDERVHNGPYLEGHGGGFGLARPEIMHKWEFEYLLEHPEFAGLYTWLGVSRDLERYDIGRFQEALAHEAVRRGIKRLIGRQ